MPLVERHIACHNILEIVDDAGRITARRRVVHALAYARGVLTHVDAADELAEVLALPSSAEPRLIGCSSTSMTSREPRSSTWPNA
jgi:hypothetical protein